VERKRVGIVLFEEIEVLDFCGPFEVFAATRLDEARRREEPSPFAVWLVAEKDSPVVTAGGMKVIPDHTFASCPRLDILVVPGGWGTRRELDNPALLDWLRHRAPEVETLTSVCTGALLLAAAGLLDGRRATTHWRSLDWLRESFPAVTVDYDQRVIEDGPVLTSAGISAGIDLALKVVERHCGEAVARATARHLEYPYPDSNARRI
jgi:transcriptional regulator GlxA family with amidase domain